MKTAIFDCEVEIVFDEAQKVLNDLGFKIKEADLHKKTFSASKSMSLWSFGEDISFRATGLNSYQTRVEVSSSSSMPLQLFDWGTNDENEDRLLTKMREKFTE